MVSNCTRSSCGSVSHSGFTAPTRSCGSSCETSLPESCARISKCRGGSGSGRVVWWAPVKGARQPVLAKGAGRQPTPQGSALPAATTHLQRLFGRQLGTLASLAAAAGAAASSSAASAALGLFVLAHPLLLRTITTAQLASGAVAVFARPSLRPGLDSRLKSLPHPARDTSATAAAHGHQPEGRLGRARVGGCASPTGRATRGRQGPQRPAPCAGRSHNGVCPP